MFENGADMRFIQQLLALASMSTTHTYTHVSIQKLKAVHTLTHPAKLHGQDGDVIDMEDGEPNHCNPPRILYHQQYAILLKRGAVMRSISLITLVILTSACTPETRNTQYDKSSFDVVRNGVNVDELALKCANDPKSVGFETSQECFAYAKDLLEKGQ